MIVFQHDKNMSCIEKCYEYLLYLIIHFFVYILTNKNKTVLYTGVTNNLEHRILEHYQASIRIQLNTMFIFYYFTNRINILITPLHGKKK